MNMNIRNSDQDDDAKFEGATTIRRRTSDHEPQPIQVRILTLYILIMSIGVLVLMIFGGGYFIVHLLEPKICSCECLHGDMKASPMIPQVMLSEEVIDG
jgi:hypothetical protein